MITWSGIESSDIDYCEGSIFSQWWSNGAKFVPLSTKFVPYKWFWSISFWMAVFSDEWEYTFFFYKKLSSEMSTQFLSVLSTRFLRGFLTERDLRHFCTETRSFLEKSLDSFLRTWNMSTRFLNSEKIWVLVSYKAVSYKKKMCICIISHVLFIMRCLRTR